jgi:hypothetical protein
VNLSGNAPYVPSPQDLIWFSQEDRKMQIAVASGRHQSCSVSGSESLAWRFTGGSVRQGQACVYTITPNTYRVCALQPNNLSLRETTIGAPVAVGALGGLANRGLLLRMSRGETRRPVPYGLARGSVAGQ